MRVKNMTDFRKTMRESIDMVAENHEPLIISRSNDKDVVVISLSNYNSILETLYQMSSSNNRNRLEKAMSDIAKNSEVIAKSLLDD